jgi:tRNA pseudouridine38-40 synthase
MYNRLKLSKKFNNILKQMRYFLEIAYLGKNYHGSQIQPNAASVQEVLQKNLSLLLRHPTEIVFSGRTDTGVHCKQQFAHFDTEILLDNPLFTHKINSVLPKDIAVKSIKQVKNDAHARFDAIARSYEYHFTLVKNPFIEDTASYLNRPVNFDGLQEAAAIVKEYTDFQAFCKVHTDVNTFNCHITESYWQIQEDQLIYYITANRFLRGMVRLVTGTLLDVGKGKISIKELREVIEGKDVKKAAGAVPAKGLFLSKVTYPDSIWI